MKQLILIPLLIAIMAPPVARAQLRSQAAKPGVAEQLRRPALTGDRLILGIIDLDRLRMDQTYSMGFASGSRGAGSYGLYTNRLSYPITEHLLMRVDLGYLHNPLASFQDSRLRNQGDLLYSTELNYRLANALQLNLRVGNFPYYYRPPRR